MQNSCFSFIKEIDNELYQIALDAEKLYISDFNACIFKTRLFSELFVKLLCEALKLDVSQCENHHDKLTLLKNSDYKRLLGQSTIAQLNFLRRQGNKAAHNNVGELEVSKRCLEYIYELAAWYYQLKLNQDPEIAFTLPNLEQLTQQAQITLKLPPVKIALVGQTSVGKSQLINRFVNESIANVNATPSTPSQVQYDAEIDQHPISLIDLKGLDGDVETQEAMLEAMKDAEIVLWVMKATRSANLLDEQLYQRYREYYQSNLAQNSQNTSPILVGVLNQIDQLAPIHEWQPPYLFSTELTEKMAADADQQSAEPLSEKAKNIQAALLYRQQTMDYVGKFLPLSIADEKAGSGLQELKETILELLPRARQIQIARKHAASQAQSIAQPQPEPHSTPAEEESFVSTAFDRVSALIKRYI